MRTRQSKINKKIAWVKLWYRRQNFRLREKITPKLIFHSCLGRNARTSFRLHSFLVTKLCNRKDVRAMRPI